MKTISITADIYAPKLGSIYRIYINDVLMTERSAWWNVDQSYVEENMVIRVITGSTVKIRIETIGSKELCEMKNITADGVPVEDTFIA